MGAGPEDTCAPADPADPKLVGSSLQLIFSFHFTVFSHKQPEPFPQSNPSSYPIPGVPRCESDLPTSCGPFSASVAEYFVPL